MSVSVVDVDPGMVEGGSDAVTMDVVVDEGREGGAASATPVGRGTGARGATANGAELVGPAATAGIVVVVAGTVVVVAGTAVVVVVAGTVVVVAGTAVVVVVARTVVVVAGTAVVVVVARTVVVVAGTAVVVVVAGTVVVVAGAVVVVVGSVATQLVLDTVLSSRVTAAVRASSRPCTTVPCVAVMDAEAKMVPPNSESVPSVAELVTCQKTLQGFAPLMKDTLLADAVTSVLAARKMNTESGTFCASSVRVPVISSAPPE
jgi:hypothetical protein